MLQIMYGSNRSCAHAELRDLLVPSKPRKGSLVTSALQQLIAVLSKINRAATEVEAAMVGRLGTTRVGVPNLYS